MTVVARINQLDQHVGETITLEGWLYHKTGKGKLQFLQMRDGTGVCQAVLFRGNVDDDVFEAAKGLTQESSLSVTGTVKAEPRAPGIPGGYELDVQCVGNRPDRRRLSHHAQGAWRRVPHAEPPPVAALQPAVGVHARARRDHLRHPRMAGHQRLSQRGHAHPHARRGRRHDHALRDRLSRRTGLSGANRPAL